MRRRTELLLVWLVALLATLPFVVALDGGWVFDDVWLIAKNPSIQSLDHWLSWWSTDLWDTPVAREQRTQRLVYLRPLVTTSYGLDWSLGGGNPLFFHLTNLLLHGGVCGLAILTLWRWSGQFWPALAIGALFALHPAKAESVAWISGRTDLLVTFGLLLYLWGLHVRLAQKAWGVGVELLGALIAFSSKEIAILLPVLATVEVWTHWGRPAAEQLLPQVRNDMRRVALALTPSFALAASYLALRALVLPLRPEAISGVSVVDHLQFILEAMGRYAQALFWPDDLTLYSSPIRKAPGGFHHDGGFVALGVAFLLALLTSAWWLRNRRPLATVGALLFLALIAPTSNLIIPSNSVLHAPRFLYLPSLGMALFLLAGWRMEFAPIVKKAWWGALVLLSLSSGFRVAERSQDFLSDDNFWRAELRHNPDVPFVVLAALDRDARAFDHHTALARAACGLDWANRQFSYLGLDHKFILSALNSQEKLTKDAELEKLARLDAFLRNVATGQKAQLSDGIQLTLEPESATAKRLLARPEQLALQRARVMTRMGRRAEAVAQIEAAIRQCPGCPTMQSIAAEESLRALKFSRALPLIESIADAQRRDGLRKLAAKAGQLHQRARTVPAPHDREVRASRESTLGLWGLCVEQFRERFSLGSAVPELYFHAAVCAARAGDEQTMEAWRALAGLSAGEFRTKKKSILADALSSSDQPELKFAPGGCATLEER